jgi:hypothetical protein
MNTDTDLLMALVPGAGMMIVAAAAVIYWRRVFHARFRWLWIGAGLWAIGVALKAVCAILINSTALGFMKESLPFPLFVVGGGLFIGIQSSVFEMGITLLAVAIWWQFGRDAGRAIGIGVGAGVFEAFLLGVASVVGVVAVISGAPGTGEIREQLERVAASTPAYWLVAPVERIIAILCHASSRALILLGMVKQRRSLILWGFLIFTLLDGVGGGAHVAGVIGVISTWWIELAILPFALISVAILKRCYARWRAETVETPDQAAGRGAGIPPVA